MIEHIKNRDAHNRADVIDRIRSIRKIVHTKRIEEEDSIEAHTIQENSIVYRSSTDIDLCKQNVL